MSEVLTVTCDSCGSRIGKASRTRVRFSAQPQRREPLDACPDCAAKIIAAMTPKRVDATRKAPRPRPVRPTV